MKIGILTFHLGNYGATLQAYALQEHLTELGHNVEIINYVPKYEKLRHIPIRRSLNLNFWGCIKLYIRTILDIPQRKSMVFLSWRKLKAFAAFKEKHYNFSKNFNPQKQDKLNDYDTVIFGSDQIWNLNLTNNGDEIFLGHYPLGKENARYIAYAISAGAAYNDLIKDNKAIPNIDRFHAISVRESILADTLQGFYKKDIATVLDPTLLASNKIWEIFTKDAIVKEKYVLVYQVLSNKNTNKLAKNIAKQLGAKVIKIWAGYSKNKETHTKHTSPSDFVNLFKYASCVVTTSFHGTVFSLIFKKDFYFASSNHPLENRVIQTLNYFNLENRILTSTDINFSKINWEKLDLDSKLEDLKESSNNFLLNALKKD